MKAPLQIALALAALLLPPGAGLLVLPLAMVLGASPLVLSALLAFGLVPYAAPLRTSLAAATATASTDEVRREGALQVRGRWRAPPGSAGFLETERGPLPLSFADGLHPPSPGTPLVARARARGTELLAITVQATGPPEGAWLDRWCAAATARVHALVSKDNAGLVVALLLGQQQDVAFPVKADCRVTGLSHVLSLSGMHVALVAATWQRWGWPPATAAVLGSFVLLAGSGAPLVRSGLGWAWVHAGTRSGRRLPGLQRLAAAALLMEAWWPGLHTQLSAQLSFLAVAGLMAAAGIVRPPFGLLLAPAGAFLATAPLCAEAFGRVAPIGLLATPLLTPALSVILAVGLIAVLPGALFSALDPLASPLLDAAASVFRGQVAWIARHAPAPLAPPPPPLPGWLLGLLVVAALWQLSRWRAQQGRLQDAVP